MISNLTSALSANWTNHFRSAWEIRMMALSRVFDGSRRRTRRQGKEFGEWRPAQGERALRLHE